MSKDLKSRAKGYAHSYPFAKVSDAYIAGAKDLYDEITQWYDPDKVLPPTNEEVLCMINRPHQTYAIMRYLHGKWWEAHHEDVLTPEGSWVAYNGIVIIWREIHE